MLKKIVVMGILFTLTFTMGCTLQDPRKNPSYSIFPEIILDYDFDSDDTKVWVKSALSDFKYDRINIEISYGEIKQSVDDNNTYCLYMHTKLLIFNLTISVVAENKEFNFDSNVKVDLNGEHLLILAIYDDGDIKEEMILEDDLPYKKVLKELR